MRQSTTSIPSGALVVVAVLAAALLVGTGPVLAQDDPTNATDTTDIDATPDGETVTELPVDGAAAGDTATTLGDGTDGSPSITFDDQASAAGESVLVASATVPEGGFVVIAEGPPTDEGSYGTLRGVSYALGPGTSDNIRIPLDRQPINESGTTSLIALLHRDTNDNGEFDFNSSQGQQDRPYTGEGGPVLTLAEITVQSGSGPTTGMETETTTGDAGGVDTETATTTETASETTTAEPTATEGGDGGGGSNLPGPGFGVVVAVVAVLAAGLVAARRDRRSP